MPQFKKAIILALCSAATVSCTNVFLKKGIGEPGASELHGVSSLDLGAFWLTTTYSNVPPYHNSSNAGAGVAHRRKLTSSSAVVYVKSRTQAACAERAVEMLASKIISWTRELHLQLRWVEQAIIEVHVGAASGTYYRNHLIARSGAPKVKFWLPMPPSCDGPELARWTDERTATIIHELAHVHARGKFPDEIESEIYARFAEVCTDYAENGTVDVWPTRLSLSDGEWEDLSSGETESWTRFVGRTRNLPATAASAVLVTANFRAFDYPDQPDQTVGEICAAYRSGAESIQATMIVPASKTGS